MQEKWSTRQVTRLCAAVLERPLGDLTFGWGGLGANGESRWAYHVLSGRLFETANHWQCEDLLYE